MNVLYIYANWNVIWFNIVPPCCLQLTAFWPSFHYSSISHNLSPSSLLPSLLHLIHGPPHSLPSVLLFWLHPAFCPSSSSSRLQVESSKETDPSSQRGAGHDRVSASSCPEAQPVLESWDGAAHQQQQVSTSQLDFHSYCIFFTLENKYRLFCHMDYPHFFPVGGRPALGPYIADKMEGSWDFRVQILFYCKANKFTVHEIEKLCGHLVTYSIPGYTYRKLWMISYQQMQTAVQNITYCRMRPFISVFY